MGLLMFKVLVPWVAYVGDPWVVHDLLFVIYGQLIGRPWGTYGSPVSFYSSPTGRPWSHVGILSICSMGFPNVYSDDLWGAHGLPLHIANP